MNNKIISVGYEIPGHSNDCVYFSSRQSLMEADILLISPNSLKPSGSWINFTQSDCGCYDIDASRTYKEKISNFKKELTDHLNAGKNAFILLTEKEEYSLALSVSTEKKGQRSYSTETYDNYKFLPINIGIMTSVSGNHIVFTGNPIFSEFYKIFERHLKYKLYIEKPDSPQIIFTGKDRNKILGALFKVGAGHLIVLPYIDYDYHEFTTTKKDKEGKQKECWTKDAIKFGDILIGKLVQIDKALQQYSEKTPLPEWTQIKEFSSDKELELQNAIAVENEKISQIKQQIEKLEKELIEEQATKGLLYEKGEALENAINNALIVLGYKAENYNDGNIEIDHVIISPEGERFIGEAEGKDFHPISIEKFSQLTRIIQEDLQRKEVEKPAIGILFGNGFRLTKPLERGEQFTTKCINAAKSLNYILIKTTDLFQIVNYVKESDDEDFAKRCRIAIESSVGKIVEFPKLPTK